MNPYSPPVAPVGPYPPAPAAYDTRAPGVSDLAVEMLRQTRPWAMLFSLLSFIGSALMLFVSAAVGLMGSTLAPAGTSPFTGLIGLVYLPFAGVYVYPGIKLWGYSSAIARLVATRSPVDLESALRQQKSFWKYSGIAALAVVALYIFGIIALIAVSAVTAATKH